MLVRIKLNSIYKTVLLCIVLRIVNLDRYSLDNSALLYFNYIVAGRYVVINSVDLHYLGAQDLPLIIKFVLGSTVLSENFVYDAFVYSVLSKVRNFVVIRRAELMFVLRTMQYSNVYPILLL